MLALADLLTYSTIIVGFSGGKDSIACVLHLLELGVPKDRIELWHHEVDGREGSSLMDWPITPAYCRAFADALGLKLYFSWKVGGFEREMLRDNAPTAPTRYERPDGTIGQTGGSSSKCGTRRKFPQVSANLSVRWCSAYLKIDVGASAIRAQARFNHAKTLVITGERAEESAARANYNEFEPDRADGREVKYREFKPGGAVRKVWQGRSARHVDRWRPVHSWPERDVWAIMRRWRVRPHPAYEMGWGRVSCRDCIFGNKNQFASSRKVAPSHFNRVADYEDEFGVTIKRKVALRVLADNGTPYEAITDELAALAMSQTYAPPIITNRWRLPAGAFGEQTGPT